jgi:predicted DNA-binding transcriptional regulator
MAHDRTLGGGILAGSIIGIIVYGILLYLHTLRVLEVTAFVAVVLLLGILAWIGYTMATTPAPEPITETAQPQPAAPSAAEKKEP